VSGSGISWVICKSAPRSRPITTPVPHHSVFTGQMTFLPPNQQRQSTEGIFVFGIILLKLVSCCLLCFIMNGIVCMLKRHMKISRNGPKSQLHLTQLSTSGPVVGPTCPLWMQSTRRSSACWATVPRPCRTHMTQQLTIACKVKSSSHFYAALTLT